MAVPGRGRPKEPFGVRNRRSGKALGAWTVATPSEYGLPAARTTDLPFRPTALLWKGAFDRGARSAARRAEQPEVPIPKGSDLEC